jgi:hypothetical protein
VDEARSLSRCGAASTFAFASSNRAAERVLLWPRTRLPPERADRAKAAIHSTRRTRTYRPFAMTDGAPWTRWPPNAPTLTPRRASNTSDTPEYTSFWSASPAGEHVRSASASLPSFRSRRALLPFSRGLPIVDDNKDKEQDRRQRTPTNLGAMLRRRERDLPAAARAVAGAARTAPAVSRCAGRLALPRIQVLIAHIVDAVPPLPPPAHAARNPRGRVRPVHCTRPDLVRLRAAMVLALPHVAGALACFIFSDTP